MGRSLLTVWVRLGLRGDGDRIQPRSIKHSLPLLDSTHSYTCMYVVGPMVGVIHKWMGGGGLLRLVIHTFTYRPTYLAYSTATLSLCYSMTACNSDTLLNHI